MRTSFLPLRTAKLLIKKTFKPTSNYQKKFGQTFSFSEVPLKGNGLIFNATGKKGTAQ